MGLLSAIFGRKKTEESRAGTVFSLATAQVTLAARHQMTTTGKAGVCFRPMSSSFFTDLEREVQGLLSVGERTAQTRYKVVDDGYGFRWIILQDDDFEDLVTAAYLASQTFSEHGFEKQLLAAVFPFQMEGQEVQWIFSYRRGTFYPFVAVPGTQRRDNALEMSISAKIEGELPMEKDLERWYALWGAPFESL